MELIPRALHIRVAASRDQVQIEGVMPSVVPKGEDLVTTVQTSGCMFRNHQKRPTINGGRGGTGLQGGAAARRFRQSSSLVREIRCFYQHHSHRSRGLTYHHL